MLSTMFSASAAGAASRCLRQRPSLPLRLWNRVLSSAPFSLPPVSKIPAVPPPNLKIDPRAVSSPYFDVRNAPPPRKRRTDRRASAAQSLEDQLADAPDLPSDAAPASLSESATASDEDPASDSDAESAAEEEEFLDLARLRAERTVTAVPLPDRLTVPRLPSLFATGPTEAVELPARVFGLDEPRPDLLHRYVIYQRNKKRGRRVHAVTKTISQKRGSGKKMRPQKGGGTARAGHKRPPHWRGGAKAHGPKGGVQDYTTKLNKKVRRLGLRVALSQKLKEGNLVLVDDLKAPSFKTGALAKALRKMDIGTKYGGSTAFMVGGEKADPNLQVACRNIYGIRHVAQLGLNVYDILKHEKLILSTEAVEKMEARLG